jgi:hypothetical protein
MQARRLARRPKHATGPAQRVSDVTRPPRPNGRTGLAGALLLLLVLAAPVAGQQDDLLRPPSDPVTVDVGFTLLDVNQIDDVSQTFDFDGVVNATWLDPRLVGRMEAAMDEVWTPQLQLLNERDTQTLFRQRVEIESDGRVVYRQRIRGTLTARLDLRDFPFDTQTLPITVTTASLDPIVLEVAEGRVLRLEGELTIPDWQIELVGGRPDEVVASGGIEVPAVTFELVGSRARAYYRYAVFVPLILIVLMAWSAFWIDPGLGPSLVSVTTASIFTLIAFRFSIRLGLPKVAYMTRLELYILVVTLLVFAALAVAVRVVRLEKKGHREDGERLQRQTKWLYLGLFVVFTLLVVRW